LCYIRYNIKLEEFIMEIVIKNNAKKNVFVQLFQNLKSLCECVSILLNKEKMYIQGMDSASISIFELTLCSDWFDTYEIEKDLVLGVNLNIFAKILNVHKLNQTIQIKMVNEDLLDISFSGAEKDFDTEFHMPLINLDQEMLNITEMDYDLEFSMDSKKFKSTIDEISNFGDTVKISFEKEEEILLEINDDVLGNMKVHIDLDDVDECSVSDDENINCSFNLKLLQNISNSSKISRNVELKISSDAPLKCKYSFDGGSELCYYIAPKLNE